MRLPMMLAAALACLPLSVQAQEEEGGAPSAVNEVAGGEIGMSPAPAVSTKTASSTPGDKQGSRGTSGAPSSASGLSATQLAAAGLTPEQLTTITDAESSVTEGTQVVNWHPAPQAPPAGSGCKVMPRNVKIGVVLHNHPEPNKYVLDSTPKSCDREFCDAIGFKGRNCCPLGAEGSQERYDCEHFVLGTDRERGESGPHWMFVGAGRLTGHNNPFLAVVHLEGKTGGTAFACGNRGQYPVCGSIKLP